MTWPAPPSSTAAAVSVDVKTGEVVSMVRTRTVEGSEEPLIQCFELSQIIRKGSEKEITPDCKFADIAAIRAVLLRGNQKAVFQCRKCLFLW